MNNSVVSDLDGILKEITPVDRGWIGKAKDRTSRLVMPHRALGRLHEISERVCGITETLEPSVSKKTVLIMAGDHGVVENGVSAFPQDVTGAMVKTFLGGGAGINAIARQAGADVLVVDMGIIPEIDPDSMDGGERFLVRKVANGTTNFTKGPAMTHEEAEQSVTTGFQVTSSLFEKGVDIIGTGDMGIGNTTPSAAIGAVITGISLERMVGRGTGVDNQSLAVKRDIVKRGIEFNQPDRNNGIDVLAKIGGFEIGGIAGSILAGAYHKRPVVIDGFISTAGALIAHMLCPAIDDYIFAGHCSEEQGHRAMLDFLCMEPILDIGLRLGEGTGGALALNIIESAVTVFKEVLTFDEAGVPGKE